MDEMFQRCAGIDVHRDTVVATVRRREPAGRLHCETRTFETYHDDLARMTEWLRAESIEVVGVESTGVYWRPVVRVLQAHAGAAKVWLLNPAAVKQVPGRKSDVSDSQWLAKLVMHGLVRPSYVPPAKIQELRVLTRHRRTLVRELASHKNRIIKRIEDCGIKLASVCSDVFGKSGRAMLDALVAGTRTPTEMAQLAVGLLRKKIPTLQRALAGTLDEASRFVLRQLLARLDALISDIATVESEIEKRLADYDQQVAKLAEIPGFDRATIAVVIAETGGVMQTVDATTGEVVPIFASSDHLTSWAGLSPGSNQTGAKAKRAPCRKGNEPLRTAMVQAAWPAVRMKGTFWKHKFGQLAVRLGPQKAIVAIARRRLVCVYWVLAGDRRYVEPIQRTHPARTERLARNYVARLQSLGFDVELRTATSAQPPQANPAAA
jgi:transposase